MTIKELNSKLDTLGFFYQEENGEWEFQPSNDLGFVANLGDFEDDEVKVIRDVKTEDNKHIYAIKTYELNKSEELILDSIIKSFVIGYDLIPHRECGSVSWKKAIEVAEKDENVQNYAIARAVLDIGFKENLEAICSLTKELWLDRYDSDFTLIASVLKEMYDESEYSKNPDDIDAQIDFIYYIKDNEDEFWNKYSYML